MLNQLIALRQRETALIRPWLAQAYRRHAAAADGRNEIWQQWI
jgi:hypothetical protein